MGPRSKILPGGLTQDVWQDGVPYDPARHRALQQHITVTIPTLSGPVVDHAATQRMARPASPPLTTR